jgi:hypothetical protein
MANTAQGTSLLPGNTESASGYGDCAKIRSLICPLRNCLAVVRSAKSLAVVFGDTVKIRWLQALK